MTPFPDTLPQPGQVFRHTDGGLYRFVGFARDSRDTEPMFIYDHLWPFEQQAWARPAHEWASRFTEVSPAVLVEAQKVDRELAQSQITAAKAARRAAGK